VVGSSSSASGGEAFRWTSEGGMVGLGDLPGGDFGSVANDVSGDGSVVVGSSQSIYGQEAFRWTAESGMVGLGYLSSDELEEPESRATGVSDDGSIVVGSSVILSGEYPWEMPFRWTAGDGMVGLDIIDGHAYDVSADGSVVVGKIFGDEFSRGFRWEDWGFSWEDDWAILKRLPCSVGVYSGVSAEGVSADGSVVVGYSISVDPGWDEKAFRWTADGATCLENLPDGEDSRAYGVSANGSVVVGCVINYIVFDLNKFSYCDGAFIWDSINGRRRLKDVLTDQYGLDLTGWSLNSANAISGDGKTIAGDGTNPAGKTEAWIANISIEVRTILGDFNKDDVVDALDYQEFRKTLGKCSGDTSFNSEADYDEDGCVSYRDYRIWYGYYLEYSE
jgi:probable HAF family extracellular repeat protein